MAPRDVAATGSRSIATGSEIGATWPFVAGRAAREPLWCGERDIQPVMRCRRPMVAFPRGAFVASFDRRARPRAENPRRLVGPVRRGVPVRFLLVAIAALAAWCALGA